LSLRRALNRYSWLLAAGALVALGVSLAWVLAGPWAALGAGLAAAALAVAGQRVLRNRPGPGGEEEVVQAIGRGQPALVEFYSNY